MAEPLQTMSNRLYQTFNLWVDGSSPSGRKYLQLFIGARRAHRKRFSMLTASACACCGILPRGLR